MPADYAPPAVAIGAAGEIYVALTRFDPPGTVGVEILRSIDDGVTYSPYGVFADPNPEHNFLAPALVHLTGATGGDALVVALLEQTPDEFRMRVARTLAVDPPSWELETVVVAEVIQEPALAVDPEDPDRVYLAYRAPRINGGLEVVLDFARSTDGGASWSVPVEVASALIPEEITSAALHAGPGGIVHVGWVVRDLVASRLAHRRHLTGGDPAVPFEAETGVVGAALAPSAVCMSGSTGPDVLAIYAAGDGALRAAHSTDEGATFIAPDVPLVAAAEAAAEFVAARDDLYVYLLYRAGGDEILYRPILARNPGGPSSASAVSDDGEPTFALGMAVWPGSGPAAVWLKREGELGRPFLDAVWFGPAAIDLAAAVPERVKVGASPNPFHESTTVEIELVAAGSMRIAAYNAAGRLVRVLHDGPLPEGRSRIPWDGRDARGGPVAAGSYYVQLLFPGGQAGVRAVSLR